jgi:NAD(P)-dependent dehydrogenase (short-subunit alcohol dehydrogenase family)
MATSPDPQSLFSVRGKVALITGATGALGHVATLALARAGAKTVITASNAGALDKLAAEVKAAGGEAQSVARRAEKEADAQAMVDAAVKAFGGLDIVIAAAGTNNPQPIVEQSLENWEAIMDANVRGSWLVCKAAGAQMIKQGRGGKVVLVSSARSVRGHPAGYGGYCTSKSAIDGLTRTLGCEWGKYKINVNAIGPTVFRSPLTEWMFGEDERAKTVRTGFLTRLPLGRLGEPEDLAGVLMFLSSSASDFCTGQTIFVDGGYTAG